MRHALWLLGAFAISGCGSAREPEATPGKKLGPTNYLFARITEKPVQAVALTYAIMLDTGEASVLAKDEACVAQTAEETFDGPRLDEARLLFAQPRLTQLRDTAAAQVPPSKKPASRGVACPPVEDIPQQFGPTPGSPLVSLHLTHPPSKNTGTASEQLDFWPPYSAEVEDVLGLFDGLRDRAE